MGFKFNPFSGNFDEVQDISNLITGPASATDNAIARFDGTTGKLVQNSSVSVQDDGRVTLGADGTSSLDAVTKQQLDAVQSGVKVKDGVIVATTANITLSGEQTIDGVLTSASRVLVKNQSTQSQNGIYVSAAGAWARSVDADTAEELNDALVTVAQGSTQANTGWYQTSEIVTLGTDNVLFSQFFGAGTYVADGQGIELSGSTFSLELDGSTLSKSASGLKVADATLNAKANIELNNLGTTAINADLIFAKTAPVFKSQNGTTSQALIIETGDASAGNSGALTLRSGTASGTRGDVTVSGRVVNLTSISGLSITGNASPSANNTYNLGAPTAAWSILYTRLVLGRNGDFAAGSDFNTAFNSLFQSGHSNTSAATGSATFQSGDQLTSGTGTVGQAIFRSGNTAAGNSNPTALVTLKSGDAAGSGNSGDVLISVGTVTTGTRGRIRLTDSSLSGSAVGYVWTLNNTSTGAGQWQAPTSVFDVNSISTNTSAAANQTYLVDTTGGAVVVTLPAPAADRYVVVKDKGNAGTNNITVNPNAAETIDGAASDIISSAYGSNIYVSDGTNWFIV